MVSIHLIMNGGIIERAEKGTLSYTESEIKEKIATAYSEYQMSKYQNGITFIQALANSGINVEESAITGSDSDGYTVTYNGKDYPVSATGSVGDGIAQWKQNSDGSISKGETTGIQVGDTVHYETILNQSANAVDSTKPETLKSDLATYSGDSSSTDNSSIARENLTWKVLDVKDGKIRLISSVPTGKKIKLYGFNGYNNAVYLIDEACSTLYGSNKGTAQNLKIEDIEEKIDKSQFDYTQYTNNNITPNIKYGETKEYTSNLQYPHIYSSEDGCKAISSSDNTGNTLSLSSQIGQITGKSTATSRLKVTQTSWWHKAMESTDFINSKYYTLFINNGSYYSSYWVSSRCVYCDSDYIRFRMRYVGEGFVTVFDIFNSIGNSNGNAYVFRPVITLSLNVTLNGNSTNGWTIQ